MSKAAILTWMVWWFSLSSLCQNTDSVKMLTSPLQQFHLSADSSNARIRKVSVSNLKDVDINDIPGTVILISHDDIAMTGARDIMELLATIPGFSFGMDVDNAIGLGIRGLWAEEGKFLIMINGIPLNELDYGTYNFAQRFALDNVDHIEIIKGPGSVIYGGTAELGVINVITLQSTSNEGSFATYKFGHAGGHVAKSQITFNGNHYIGNETFISFFGTYNQGAKSAAVMPNSNLKYADSTGIHDSEISLLLKRKNTSIQYYYNNYSSQVFGVPYDVLVQLQALDFKQEFKLNSKHYISFKTNYTYQIPWTYLNSLEADRLASNTQVNRVLSTVNWNATFSKKLETLLGINAYRQKEIQHGVSHFPFLKPQDYFHTNASWVTGISIFGDAICHLPWFNLSIGGRSEINNHVPWQITPRLGITRQWKKAAIKLAQTSAYKIPTLQNITLGPKDQPLRTEVSSTSEIAISFMPKSWFTLSAQVYRTLIAHPIVYISDSIVLDSYVNRPSVGTQGFEFNADLKRKRWSAKIGFFAYQKISKFVDFHEVQIQGFKGLQGMPTQQANLTLSYKLNENTSLGYVLNQQHGLSALIANNEGNVERQNFKDVYLMRVFVTTQWLDDKSLQIQVGINNVLNQQFFLTSAYTSDITPFPIAQRELMLSVKYLITK